MKHTDKQRVLAFRRIIREKGEGPHFKCLQDMSDEALLDVLNASIIPNSFLPRVLRFSLFSSLVFARSNGERKKIVKSIEQIKDLVSLMSPREKELYKFGVLQGITKENAQKTFERFIRLPTDPFAPDLNNKKKISTYSFYQIYPFIKKILKKGENGEQFPRV